MLNSKTRHNEPVKGGQVYEYHSKVNGNDILDVSEECNEIDNGFFGHGGKPSLKNYKIAKKKMGC